MVLGFGSLGVLGFPIQFHGSRWSSKGEGGNRLGVGVPSWSCESARAASHAAGFHKRLLCFSEHSMRSNLELRGKGEAVFLGDQETSLPNWVIIWKHLGHEGRPVSSPRLLRLCLPLGEGRSLCPSSPGARSCPPTAARGGISALTRVTFARKLDLLGVSQPAPP